MPNLQPYHPWLHAVEICRVGSRWFKQLETAGFEFVVILFSPSASWDAVHGMQCTLRRFTCGEQH